MKLRLPRRRLWRAAIYLVSLLLVLLAADLVLVHVRREITPSFDTTRILGPLKADGTIDYLTALDDEFGEGVTPENNAAVLFLQAVGRAGLPFTQPPDGITGKMGMPHVPEKGDYFVDYNDFFQTKSYEDSPPDPTDTTRPSVWPVFDAKAEQWIAANQHPLDLAVAASRRSRFFIPMNGGNPPELMNSVILPQMSLMNGIAQAIEIRALMRLQNGDDIGFDEDLLAVHRLARLFKCPFLVQRFVEMQIETSACRTGRIAADSGKLSPQQAKELAVQLIAMGDLPDMSDSMSGERFFGLEFAQTLASSSPSQDAKLMMGITLFSRDRQFGETIFLMGLGMAPIPYERSMQTLNHIYDGAIAAMDQQTFAQRAAAIDLWTHDLYGIWLEDQTSALLSGDFPAQLCVGFLNGFLNTQESTRMERRLTQVALALAAYKSDRGGYPMALAELSPDYLAEVPIDSFDEKPLIYARTDVGYTLYSVGPNMKDNGGKSDKPADDIVASLP